jgi:hypothetical protein
MEKIIILLPVFIFIWAVLSGNAEFGKWGEGNKDSND